MLRTTVYIPANVLARVQVVAADRGVSTAAIIRSVLAGAAGTHRPAPVGGFLASKGEQ